MEEPFGEESRPDSEKGTDLHTYFRTVKSYDALSPADRETMKAADRYADDFIGQFKDNFGLDEDAKAESEHEIELTGTIPGHPDNVLTFCRGEYVVILDFKSGFVEVEDAPSNRQLAAYSLLLWERAPFQACGVAIIQPNALGPRLTSAIYTGEQMPGVRAALEEIRDSTLDPNAQPVAGEVQCRWCKAKAVCPAYTAGFAQLQTLDKSLAVETLSAHDLAALKQIIQRAKQLSDSVDAEMRARIERDEMPGWHLQNTGSTRKLIDGLGLFQAMAERFEGVADFATRYTRCLEAKWGLLEELVAHLAVIPEKQAKESVQEIAAPYVQLTEKAKSIVVDKPKKLK